MYNPYTFTFKCKCRIVQWETLERYVAAVQNYQVNCDCAATKRPKSPPLHRHSLQMMVSISLLKTIISKTTLPYLCQ